MPDRDTSFPMGFHPDPDHVMWYLIGLAALGFAMAILGIVGEILGWWNDTGEILVTVGTLVGLLVSGGAFIYGAGRDQVTDVKQAVLDNGRTLTSVDGKLENLDKLDDLDVVQAKLDTQTGVLGRQLSVLETIRDRL